MVCVSQVRSTHPQALSRTLSPTDVCSSGADSPRTHALVIAFPLAFFTALFIMGIVAFRALVNAYNELPAPHDNAWMAWMTLGGICVLAGAFLWNKRKARA